MHNGNSNDELGSQQKLRDLKTGTQFLDSKNAQHNLEIVQIPRLCGTYSPCIVISSFTKSTSGWFSLAVFWSFNLCRFAFSHSCSPQDPISASLLVHVLHLCVRLRVQQIDTEDVMVGSSWCVCGDMISPYVEVWRMVCEEWPMVFEGGDVTVCGHVGCDIMVYWVYHHGMWGVTSWWIGRGIMACGVCCAHGIF